MARGTAKSDISGARLTEALVRSGAYGSGGTTPKGLTPKPTKGTSRSDAISVWYRSALTDKLATALKEAEAKWEANGSGKKFRQELVNAQIAYDEFKARTAKGTSKSDVTDRIIKTLVDGAARPVPTKGGSKSDMTQMVTDLENKKSGNIADDRIGTIIKGSSKSDIAELTRYMKVEGVKVVKDMLKKDVPGLSNKDVNDTAKKFVKEVIKQLPELRNSGAGLPDRSNENPGRKLGVGRDK